MQDMESPEVTEGESPDVPEPGEVSLLDHDGLRDAIAARLAVEGESYRNLVLADIAATMYEFRMMVEGLTGMIGDGSGAMGKMVGRMMKRGTK